MYEVFESLLELKGVTVADVSRATGISQSTLSNWKKRRNRISAANAQKLADYFGVSVGYIFGVQEDAQGSEYYENVASALEAQRMFDDKEIHALFHVKKNINPERFKAFYDMIIAYYKMENPDDDYNFDIGEQTERPDDV